MSAARRAPFFLTHIVEAIDRIYLYVEGLDEDAFQRSSMVQDAVIRNFGIIGEACNNVRKVDPTLVAGHPEVPWTDAIANRNILSHGYFTIDHAVVWTTLKRDLPALRAAVAALLP